MMRAAHRLGMSTTATMMWGHVETLEERIDHLRQIRDLQDEMGGFRAFISWTFQPDNTELAEQVTWFPTSVDYLLMQAVSRIYLDNVDHIQSSWVTQGMKVGQVALFYGADDLGSIMIEENVVSAAGTTHRAGVEDFLHTIRNAGFRPSQRDTLYRPCGTTTSRPRDAPGVRDPSLPAPPEQVWPWIADPHMHVRTLPDSVSKIEVSDDGDVACVVTAMGVSEPMIVRVVEAVEPTRLVERRVDGGREATTIFEVEPDGDGSMVTLTSEIEVPEADRRHCQGTRREGAARAASRTSTG